MAFNSLLVGPPGVYPNTTNTTTNNNDTVTIPTAQFRNLTVNNTTISIPRFGFTENNSLTYIATGNPCLDFFFHVVPGIPSSSLIERLIKAWNYDPLTTLKLVCNLRGVRGTGKSDRERFYIAALWLHKNHPKTLAFNVKVFAEFGYYKDLLEVLYRLLEGEDARHKARQESRLSRRKVPIFSRKIRSFSKKRTRKSHKARNFTANEHLKLEMRSKLPKQVRIDQHKAKIEAERAQARTLRKEKHFDKVKKAFERYTTDPNFSFLHDSVSDMFADALKQDMKFLESGEVTKISLASKWCPSIDSFYDRSTLICENIARRVFPKENYVEYEGMEEAHYAYRIRDRLRKDVLVPLHKVLEIPEVYMSANRWEDLPYNRVPSVAMKNYKEQFLRHDSERFKGYLEDVKRGAAKIAAGALLPHEIIASLNDVDGGKVAELQWERMVNDMLKKGKMNNCIAVCDVSGSMSGTPMEVCVALALLISELSEEPWKGKVISFSANPQIHLIEGNNLLDKTQFVRRMDWGYNTNFQKVFDQILEVAVNGGLRDDQMIKRVFVFSDMEFDQACGHTCNYYGCYRYDSDSESDYSDMDSDIDYEDISESELEKKLKQKEDKQLKRMEQIQGRMTGWETDYEVIERKFNEKGYKVPEIVFWNLRYSSATPVPANQKGVALVSGFSKNLAKLFLDNGGIVDPVAVLEQAISGALYQKLVLCD